MKKYLIIALSVLAVGCSPSKEQARKSYMQGCLSEAEKQMPGAGTKAILDRYCGCTADKVLAKYTAEELNTMSKGSKAEMTEKMMPLVQNCVDSLGIELQAYYEAHPNEQMPTPGGM